MILFIEIKPCLTDDQKRISKLEQDMASLTVGLNKAITILSELTTVVGRLAELVNKVNG